MARYSALQKSKIGERIKHIRQSLSLDQTEFGNRITPHTSASNVSRWERGLNVPSTERLHSIAEIGHTTIEFLEHGVDDKTFESLNYAYDNIKSQFNNLVSKMTIDDLKDLELGNLSNMEIQMLGNFVSILNEIKKIEDPQDKKNMESALNTAIIELSNLLIAETDDPIIDFKEALMTASIGMNRAIYQMLDYREKIGY